MHFNGYQKGEETVHAIKNYGCTPRGIWNLSFLGWFRPATLSDFYDENGNHIGLIHGRLATIGKAHFDFYDKDGNKVAYAKHETTQIVIRDINTDTDIAFLWRDVKPGVEDTWTLSLTNKLDRRIAFVFAAYIVNNQSYFLKDDSR